MIQSAVARKNGREPEGPVGKGRDDFFLIFLFTFFIKGPISLRLRAREP
jgi:hypothetical protein